MDLRGLLRPRSVAIVGASDRPYSRQMYDNLIRHGFKGRIVLVNRSRTELFGQPCVPSLAATDPVDCAALMVSRDAMEAVVAEAIAAGAKSIIVPAAGFRESHEPQWVEVEARIGAYARAHDVPLIGPNAVGVYSGPSRSPLIMASVPGPLPLGGVSLLMSSGGSMVGALHYLRNLGAGVRYAISVGNGAMLGMGELTLAMARDRQVTAIGLQLEDVRDWDLFREGAEHAARAGKLVVALKMGRSPKGKQMAATHTGALAGEYPVYRDVLRQVGVRVVDTLGAMVVAVSLRDKFGIWKQQRDLAVMAISGGVAGQVADECHLYQIPLANLEPATLDAIRGAKASIEPDNPVDLSPAGSQNSEGFISATRAFLSDPNVGAGLYVHAQAMPDSNLAVQLGLQDNVVDIAQGLGVPLVLSQLTYSLWSAEQHQYYRGYQRALAVTVLEDAVAGLAAWRGPTEPPAEAAQPSGLDDRPQWHNEFEVKRMLASAGVLVPRAELIPPDQVESVMNVKLKRPLVLKGVGLKIYHKNRLGLVRLGLRSKTELKRAVLEMEEKRLPVEGWLIEQEADGGVDAIISIVRQPLGDVLMVGSGGVDVETSRSVAFAALPVSREHLVKMLARADLPLAIVATVNKLIGFYRQHGLSTLECNPVRITGNRATVLDVVATK